MSRFEQTNTEKVSIDGDEPVGLEEAKKWAFVTGSIDDGTIEGLITAARSYCEGHTWKQVVESTLKHYRDDFPTREFRLPIGPCIEVLSIIYIDGNGNEQTLDESAYDVDAVSHYARIQPIDSWPGTKDIYNAVTVTFKAGYDGSNERLNTPSRIKQAMKLMIKHWFENRSAVVIGNTQSVDAKEVPMTANALLDLESKKRPI